MVVNGGLRDRAAVRAALSWCDGVMLGREAYHRPYLLAELQQPLRPREAPHPTREELLERMAALRRRELEAGDAPVDAITRHMLGLYSGQPGARDYRRTLSEGARECGRGPSSCGMPCPAAEVADAGGLLAAGGRLRIIGCAAWEKTSNSPFCLPTSWDRPGSTTSWATCARATWLRSASTSCAAPPSSAGTVIKTMGDEVMATFPSADAALNAAAQMQQQISSHAQLKVDGHPATSLPKMTGRR